MGTKSKDKWGQRIRTNGGSEDDKGEEIRTVNRVRRSGRVRSSAMYSSESVTFSHSGGMLKF